MRSFPRSISVILVLTEFVLGNFANVFIALVNCVDWIKRRKISCADQILTALAFSRIGLLWVIIFQLYALLFNLGFCSSGVRTIVITAWIVCNHFSLWLATSLSIFYLLKIANFSSFLFLHLKCKAQRVILMILSGTLVFMVCHLAVVSLEEKMRMKQYEGNFTGETTLWDTVHFSNMIVFTIIYFIPSIMSLTAFLLLIFSLWKHMKKMRLSGKGCQDSSMKIHVRALQTVVSFLLLLVIYFLAQVISMWKSNLLKNNLIGMVLQVLGLLYPSSHSFILIWGNKKLRQAFLSFLWQLRCA